MPSLQATRQAPVPFVHALARFAPPVHAVPGLGPRREAPNGVPRLPVQRAGTHRVQPGRTLPRALVALLAAAAIVAAGVGAPLALANGRPIQIVLTYLPNISNTGTTAASGIAELVMAEGEVRVAATGLPRLDPPQRYQAWIVNTNTNEALPLGQFNTAYTSGAANLDQVLPQAIPDKGWNLFLVTIEDAAAPARPGERHSIAGFFPTSGSSQLPSQLPNTGGPVPPQLAATGNRPEWTVAAGLAALTLVLGGVAGYLLGRRKVASR